MSLPRRVEPEWLDVLPPLDPRALRSRRDLQRVNAVMGHARLAALPLAAVLPRPPRDLGEIGAGDGTWLVQLAHALPASWAPRAVLLDRQDAVSGDTLARLAARGWTPEVVKDDARAWLARRNACCDVIVANLFLHHFERDELAELLALVAARARVFIACEPRRCARALHASRLLALIGCNAVTRHDASVSVRAGFAGAELSALWPHPGWRLEERARGWFSHLFLAVKRTAAHETL